MEALTYGPYAWRPCLCCDELCPTQLEHTETRNGKPYPFCSGCDPAMDLDYKCACRQLMLPGFPRPGFSVVAQV